jgi:hypothetical protein
VAQRYFAEVPVHRLDQNDFKESLARLVLKSVDTGRRGGIDDRLVTEQERNFAGDVADDR